MTDQFINPITQSFHLLESYRNLLRKTLTGAELSPKDVESIMGTVQIDQGLYFSINRKFQQAEKAFPQFCRDSGLADDLPQCFFSPSDHLYAHQEKAIHSILDGNATIISSGTGSGKTEAFLIPIVDHCLKNPSPGVKALIIYPTNALANDQLGRLVKALRDTKISFGAFVGTTPENSSEEKVVPQCSNHRVYREHMRTDPPDILITNYVMLDWMLTRPGDLAMFQASEETLRFIVLDEVHTYRGNKAAHLKYLLARLKANLTLAVIQIATSATLRRKTGVEAYIDASIDEVDEFAKPLLDVEHYNLVEPNYQETPRPSQSSAIPDDLYNHQETLDWVMRPEIDTALEALGMLTGQRYSLMDMAKQPFRDSEMFHDLQENIFVVTLRKELEHEASLSFADMVALFCSLVPPGKETRYPERMVKAYLSAISFLNHHSSQEEPFLDYRIHLFLRDIGGNLKLCLKCERYHAGNQDFCTECGFPLFLVYKEDVRRCIGKVSGSTLKWELRPETDDRENSYYVLVQTKDDIHENDMGFNQQSSITPEGLELEYDPCGGLRLTPMPEIRHHNVFAQTIKLVAHKKDYEYLYQFTKTLLGELPTGQKKILGFVDSREKASRYGTVLRHEFAHDFLCEFLKLHYPREVNLGLEDTFKHLRKQVPTDKHQSELENNIFKELRLWYLNLIKTPPDGKDYLALGDLDDLDAIDEEVLKVFIKERAIRIDGPDEDAPGKFIRFSTYHAKLQRGIHTLPENFSSLREHPNLSLGKDAEKYRGLVDKYGARNIQDSIDALTRRGVLHKGTTKDDKTHYYLNSEHVVFKELPYPEYDQYEQIKEDLLLTAQTHSSEIDKQGRKEFETKFNDGEIHLLMATSTLELGVDIGELQCVMMVGVPPMPSNYSQRAGRAGRKARNHFAVIVSYCFDYDNRDNYYFQYPKQMIDGEISPPAFDPLNDKVLAKHFNAFMLSGEALTRDNLQNFTVKESVVLEKEVRDAQDVFSLDEETTRLLQMKFFDALGKQIRNAKQNHLQIQFYNDDFFPDYSFRRDQIYVLPESCKEAIKEVDRKPENNFVREHAISECEPEMAYSKFTLGSTVFMAGDVYKITADGPHDERTLHDGQKARSYQHMFASRKDGYARRGKIRRRYALETRFQAPETYRAIEGVLSVGFHPSCRIAFINRGTKQGPNGYESFSDNGARFVLRYEIERPALILRVPDGIGVPYLSLASVLDRTIKDRCGLDEGELKVLLGAHSSDAKDNKQNSHVIFYDAPGSGAVRLQKVDKELDDILDSAYEKLNACESCKTGCYKCLKSHSLRRSEHIANKQDAIMLTGYLTGKKDVFTPSIALPLRLEQAAKRRTLTLTVNLVGSKVVVESSESISTYESEIGTDQNEAIFTSLIKGIQAEFKPSMTDLLIRSRQRYIRNAIKKGTIKKGKGAFALLQFNLLRFKYVHR